MITIRNLHFFLFGLCITTMFFVQSCRKDDAPIVKNTGVSLAQEAQIVAYNTSPITWGYAKGLITPTHEINGAVVNNKLYIFGGHDYAGRPTYWRETKRAFVYDPSTNTWAAIADLPHSPSGTAFGGVTNEGLATDGTSIYLAGGYICNANGTGQIFGTQQVWKYNPSSNNYERLPDLPRPLAVGQLEILNGKLHFMGGADLSRTDVATHYVLDLNNISLGWKTLAPLPNAVNQSGSAVLNGKIYIIGGSHNHDAATVKQNTVQVYDEVSNSWSFLAPMKVGRDHIASSITVVGNKILVLGGETAYNVTSKLVSAYSLSTNSWSELTAMPAARSGGVAAIIGNQLYYAGGNFSQSNFKGNVPASNNTTTLSASDDSYVRDGSYSHDNYGRDTTMFVKGGNLSGYEKSTYIRFSLPDITNLVSAKLRLFGYNTENTQNITLSCFELQNNDWTEGSLTFSNAPKAKQPSVATAIVNNTHQFIEFDITSYVTEQFSAANNKVNLVISDTTKKNSNILFTSREGAANPPQLILYSIE